GEPIIDEDPLAGLNLLEDNRFFVHEPEHEQHSTEPAEAERSHEPVAEEVHHIESVELDAEQENGEQPAPAPVARSAHKPPMKKEPAPVERVEEEEDEVEEEPEEQEEEEERP